MFSSAHGIITIFIMICVDDLAELSLLHDFIVEFWPSAYPGMERSRKLSQRMEIESVNYEAEDIHAIKA